MPVALRSELGHLPVLEGLPGRVLRVDREQVEGGHLVELLEGALAGAGRAGADQVDQVDPAGLGHLLLLKEEENVSEVSEEVSNEVTVKRSVRQTMRYVRSVRSP